jgi:hypothetical protein
MLAIIDTNFLSFVQKIAVTSEKIVDRWSESIENLPAGKQLKLDLRCVNLVVSTS